MPRIVWNADSTIIDKGLRTRTSITIVMLVAITQLLPCGTSRITCDYFACIGNTAVLVCRCKIYCGSRPRGTMQYVAGDALGHGQFRQITAVLSSIPTQS